MKLTNLLKEAEMAAASAAQQEKMSPEQKRQLLSMVSKYNECGKQLYGYGDVRTIAESLLKVTELAEKYALEECNEDFLQTGNVQKDMKDIRREATELNKVAREAWIANERMKALYENIGSKLNRYYELS